MGHQQQHSHQHRGHHHRHDHEHDHEHDHDHDHEHGHDHHHDHGDEYGHEYDIYPKRFIEVYQSSQLEGQIIDVRDEWEFKKVRLLGSINIPLRHMPEHIDSLNPSQIYYIICSQGIRSSFAAEYLIESEFSHVHVIQTGIYGLCEYIEDEIGDTPWIIKE
ncbi:hypothetical protein SD71_11530 [Cohnella kolymensis]|uniref:Rhodanese domain-containing protein n=1 Tax=Cohnella kolymensis TaxID=1590652 RepID=A0ABR5A4J1_9BACL|nr:rhodanese-like domain-containing protein [Cohnella kolymensis]KIL35968.1 hypothetical protein SD71_11530 [Cohnella kolymensis]